MKRAENYGESIVDTLLEHCGHCGTPTKVTLKPQAIDLSRISPKEKQMGTKVEKEHVTGAKDAIAVAAAHWAEDPKYYAHGKKKGVFPELGKAKAMFMAGGSMGAMAGGAGAQM